MSFDSDRDDTEGIWFEYPEAPDETYCIRPLTPEGVTHFRKLTTRRTRDRAGQWVDKEDDEKYREYLWDHLIADWRTASEYAGQPSKGIVDRDGKPVPCTLENKLKLAAKSGARALWVTQQAEMIANDDVARLEAARQSFRAVDQAPVGLSSS